MKALPRIRGGLELVRDKPGLSSPIVTVPAPAVLIRPLVGHGGQTLPPCVAVGDSVQVGTPLADGVVATQAGHVRAMRTQRILHPAPLDVPCLIIDTDLDASPAPVAQSHWSAGVGGHGGAGFPLARKLAALDAAGGCRLLIVNACECEPGIACDEALLLAAAPAVVESLLRFCEALSVHRSQVVIAIEADKPGAIAALSAALQDACDIDLMRVAPVYPSGAERPLVELVLRERGLAPLARSVAPTSAGVLCANVATVHAAGQAIIGTVPTRRIITVALDGGRTMHASVVLGTPVRHVLEALGQPCLPHTQVRIGGPLSGYLSDALDAPVTITTHAIAVQGEPHAPVTQPRPCIRCGECAPACPVGLQPQLLHWHARSNDVAALQRHGLNDCIECGCCDVVCPSGIALTTQFRTAHGDARNAAARAVRAAHADTLYQQHQARLARDARRQPASSPATGASRASTSVNAALERARAKATRP